MYGYERPSNSLIWRAPTDLYVSLTPEFGNDGRDIDEAKAKASSNTDWQEVADRIYLLLQKENSDLTPETKIAVLINFAVAHRFAEGVDGWSETWIKGSLKTATNLLGECKSGHTYLESKVRKAKLLLLTK